jgi:hypothetical protein
MIIYYVDSEKFITDDYNKIPWKEVSSPDENTPAIQNLKTY